MPLYPDDDSDPADMEKTFGTDDLPPTSSASEIRFGGPSNDASFRPLGGGQVERKPVYRPNQPILGSRPPNPNRGTAEALIDLNMTKVSSDSDRRVQRFATASPAALQHHLGAGGALAEEIRSQPLPQKGYQGEVTNAGMVSVSPVASTALRASLNRGFSGPLIMNSAKVNSVDNRPRAVGANAQPNDRNQGTLIEGSASDRPANASEGVSDTLQSKAVIYSKARTRTNYSTPLSQSPKQGSPNISVNSSVLSNIDPAGYVASSISRTPDSLNSSTERISEHRVSLRDAFNRPIIQADTLSDSSSQTRRPLGALPQVNFRAGSIEIPLPSSTPFAPDPKLELYQYSPQKDLDRMLDPGTERIVRVITTAMNTTLPFLARQSFIGPVGLADEVLSKATEGFHNGRIPLVTWSALKESSQYHGGVLLRCERPKPRVGGVTSLTFAGPDCDYMDLVYSFVNRLGGSEPDQGIAVIDTGAREPHLFEHPFSNICQFRFLSLSTQTIETAYQRVTQLCSSGLDMFEIKTFNEAVEKTGWAALITKFVQISRDTIAQRLSEGKAFLLQNASGNVSNTLSSLSQIMIDPYCRTLNGFIYTLHKDWIAYGLSATKQFAIFAHFIHCLFELMVQQPFSFEFNQYLLLFLCDSMEAGMLEMSNPDSGLMQGADPVAFQRFVGRIEARRNEFLNPFYQPNKVQGLLHVSSTTATIWFRQFARNGRSNPLLIANQNALQDSTDIQARTMADSIGLTAKDCYWAPPARGLSHSSSLMLTSGMINFLDVDFAFLSGLKSLNIDRNQFRCVPAVLAVMTKLEALSMNSNGISYFVQNFPPLPNLVQLEMVQNDLTSMKEICQFTSLTYLSLNENKIGPNLPSNFGNLVNLRQLYLRSNQLTRFPGNALIKMTGLQALSLAQNQITILPDNFSPLSNLVSLALQRNLLRELPPSVCDCINLESLTLSQNLLKALPANIGKLQKLVALYVDNNQQLKTFPNSMANCAHLKIISASSCSMESVPVWFCQLEDIENLDLSNNKLKVLSHAIGHFKKIKELNISNNQISILPSTMGNLNPNFEFQFSGNPILSPPAMVLQKGTKYIIQTLNQDLHGTREVSRIKVMLVGQDNIGKTSIVNQLAKKWQQDALQGGSLTSLEKPQTSGVPLSTDGINLHHFILTPQVAEKEQKKGIIKKKPKIKEKKKALNVAVWDFAGQEVYYATHQFFLLPRSIYLLVFSLVNPASQDCLEYWYRSIKARVKSPKVILVATHIDDKALWNGVSWDVQKIIDRVRAKLAVIDKAIDKAPFFAISSASGENVPTFIENLERIIAADNELEQTLPYSYLLLESLLEETKRELDYPVLSLQELRRLGAVCDIASDKLEKCTKILHDGGQICHFQQHEELKDLVILDPQWLLQVMSTLFTTKHRWLKNGVLEHTALKQIWKQYPENLHQKLLLLMEKFQIAFAVDGDVTSLVNVIMHNKNPSLLSNVNALMRRNTSKDFLNLASVSPAASDSSSISASLVPALLPTERPTEIINREWSPKPDFVNYDRIYRFSFLPMGLFSRVSAKLLRTANAIVAVWKTGILTGSTSYTGQSVQIFLENRNAASSASEIQKSMQDNEVIISVRGKDPVFTRNAFSAVIAILDAVAGDWTSLQWQRFAIAPVFSNNPGGGAQLISIDEIEASILHFGKDISKGVPAPNLPFADDALATIAPDLYLTNYSGPRISMADIEIGRKLGFGGYATVFQGMYQGQQMAIKQIKLPPEPSKSAISTALADFRQEIIMQGVLTHPNVVQILGITMHPLSILLELVPFGNLFDLIQDWRRPISWQYRIRVAMNMASGLKFLHDSKPIIAHLDIKSPNIFLTSLDHNDKIVAKIGDFGLARTVTGPIIERFVFNPIWLAPEAMKPNPSYSHLVDNYAFGVICWEMIVRKKFFGELGWTSTVEDRVVNGHRPQIPPDLCPTEYADIIKRCWDQEPMNRPNWDWVINLLSLLAVRIDDFANLGTSYQEKLKVEYDVIQNTPQPLPAGATSIGQAKEAVPAPLGPPPPMSLPPALPTIPLGGEPSPLMVNETFGNTYLPPPSDPAPPPPKPVNFAPPQALSFTLKNLIDDNELYSEFEEGLNESFQTMLKLWKTIFQFRLKPFTSDSAREATDIAINFLGLNGYSGNMISLEGVIDVLPVRDRILEGDIIPGLFDGLYRELTKLLQTNFSQFIQSRDWSTFVPPPSDTPAQPQLTSFNYNPALVQSAPVPATSSNYASSGPVVSPREGTGASDPKARGIYNFKYPKFLKKSLGKFLQVKKFEDIYDSPEDYEKFYRFLEAVGKLEFLLLYNAIAEFQDSMSSDLSSAFAQAQQIYQRYLRPGLVMRSALDFSTDEENGLNSVKYAMDSRNINSDLFEIATKKVTLMLKNLFIEYQSDSQKKRKNEPVVRSAPSDPLGPVAKKPLPTPPSAGSHSGTFTSSASMARSPPTPTPQSFTSSTSPPSSKPTSMDFAVGSGTFGTATVSTPMSQTVANGQPSGAFGSSQGWGSSTSVEHSRSWNAGARKGPSGNPISPRSPGVFRQNTGAIGANRSVNSSNPEDPNKQQ